MPLPEPPPEAVLLRLVRKASGVTVAQAATAAGISKAWLSSIENGHDNRGSEGVRPVRASDEIVARLAAFLNIGPDRLEAEGQRPDAAAVLREMQRRPGAPGDSAGDEIWASFTPEERRIARAFIETLRRGAAERDRRERDSA